MRKVAGPLIAYHALILFGAFLLIAPGYGVPWRLLGALLVASGIAVDLAVLVWTGLLARSAAAHPAGTSDAASEDARAGRARTVCVGCGATTNEGAATCPRCGRPVVRLA